MITKLTQAIKQIDKVTFTSKQISIEVILFLLIASSVYLMLSLISFDPADPGFSQTAWHDSIRNWGGSIGAYLADILLQFLGGVAYSIPVLIAIICLQGMIHAYHDTDKPINYFSLSLRLIGILASVFSATGFFALNIPDFEQFQAGGILGDLVADEMLLFFEQLGAFNYLGTSVILFMICLACVTLLTELSWFFITEKLGAGIVAIVTLTVTFMAKVYRWLVKASNKPDRSHTPQLDIDLNLLKDKHTRVVSDPNHAPQEDKKQDQLPLELNPPPQSSQTPSIKHDELILINPDYYTPISIANDLLLAEQDDISMPLITMFENKKIDENKNKQESKIEDENVSQATLKMIQGHIDDSLIHPLLQKDNRPLKKPTTPLPSLNLLTAPPVKHVEIDHHALKITAGLIEKSLADFRVKARVVDYLPGSVITRFEIELAPGIKASRISTLDRDLARSLSMSSVRVVEVIPGKPYVGIELPNKHRQTVYFREVLNSPQFKEAKSPLTVVLGKDIAGQSVVADLAKMPHLLVAGTTGSGKSVGVNAMILSTLYKSQPEDVRFIMIDPKMLELSVYEGIPHLLTDVVTDMKDAANALNWCVNEMEKRYRLMSALGVRNIVGYNEKIKMAQDMQRPIPDPLWRPGDSMDIDIPMLEKLPYIVVMVDEFADLIMAVGKKVEELIARLAQKARAAGIHLVLATQRPSVDVITGLIKANIPTRIAFTVSSKIDSRTILDQMGAESLLGMGDMLYLAPNSSIPIRVHGAFVQDEEVHRVVQDWKARGIPNQYIENITASSDESDSDSFNSPDEELDPLFDQVVAFVVDKRRASISSVQRQFRIGYNRAARIVEQMENQGVVSTPGHNGNREVLAPQSDQQY